MCCQGHVDNQEEEGAVEGKDKGPPLLVHHALPRVVVVPGPGVGGGGGGEDHVACRVWLDCVISRLV